MPYIFHSRYSNLLRIWWVFLLVFLFYLFAFSLSLLEIICMSDRFRVPGTVFPKITLFFVLGLYLSQVFNNGIFKVLVYSTLYQKYIHI